MKFELSERAGRNSNSLSIIYQSYKCYLATKTLSVEMTASQYAKGLLLQQGLGNMSMYANIVPGAGACRFQYSFSESPCEYRPISAQIQCDVLAHTGDARNEAIHIDETSSPKQDRDSVGVKCQYSGRPGKFVWVVVDTSYGRQTPLLNAIGSAGIVYIADILSNSNSFELETVPGIQLEGFNE
jgi:SRSO17 transposase